MAFDGVGGELEPAALLGALVVVGRGEDIDELGDFPRPEGVDVPGLGGEGGDVVLFQRGLAGELEELAVRCDLMFGQLHRIEVRGLDLAGGAEDHAGHAGVVVRADALVHIELHEAQREIDAFL